jgi:uncharacterized protein
MKYTALLIVLLPYLTFSQGDKNFIDQNYIEVQGKSEMEIIPDMIYLRILISEKDSKNKTSITEIEKQMIAKLEGMGFNLQKDLAIKDLASNFIERVSITGARWKHCRKSVRGT